MTSGCKKYKWNVFLQDSALQVRKTLEFKQNIVHTNPVFGAGTSGCNISNSVPRILYPVACPTLLQYVIHGESLCLAAWHKLLY